jgi:DNA-binding beta-propeller fold protein YncE
MNAWARKTPIGVQVILVIVCCIVAFALQVSGAKRGKPAVADRRKENGDKPVLRVPETGSKPNIDGKLDEPCWKEAAKTGPLEITRGQPAESTTEAFILRDADHLYVGVICAGKDAAEGIGREHTSSFTPGRIAGYARSEADKLLAAHWTGEPVKPSKEVEFVELLIDSNGDRSSYYLIRITPDDGGKLVCSYNEHTPPWCDPTWQPQFKSAVAKGTGAWAVEFALPLKTFNKNKTLASEIGFNIRRSGMPGGKSYCWHGTSANPGEWGILTGIPARKNLPKPDYAISHRHYRVPPKAKRSFFAEEERRTIRLGPGSAHPGTTGEVKLELEGFLLAGDPHARGIIWDLAVNERKGELYVLSDPRPARGMAEARVFDRRGEYLRTVMPLNPTLPHSSVRDLCRKMAREGGTELAIPKLFEVSAGELSIYGPQWNLPQKMALAPNGDLIMSNVYRGTLWRIRPDGSLPLEGWTSIYHAGRNEPFESAFWTQGGLMAQDLKNYMPFHSLRYPYFCFDPDGILYISAGQSTLPTKHLTYYWEVSTQEATYHWDVNGKEGRGTHVWKCRMHPGVKVEKQISFGGFAEPSGLVLDGNHLIVADAGNNRLQVIGEDGRVVASITHYEHEGKKEPLNGPTALAIDHEKNLYVLVAPEPRPKDERVERTMPILKRAVDAAARKPPEAPRKLIKLKSWKQPELLTVSKPLHPDVLQIAVDAGVSPPLVWVANGTGLGSLVQLAGDDLSVKKEWVDSGETLSYPRQTGHMPILNIDPQTGHLYVEDDSDYRMYRYGTVYRVDQDGNVLKKWPPPPLFNNSGLKIISPWGNVNYGLNFRYPEEPLFIDSIFGKDGRVYRWKLVKAGVEILRFDRAGKPIPFKATGTNALFVDHAMEVGIWHDVYHGMDVDRHGNIYFVAKVDVDSKSRPVSPFVASHRQVNVYDADGNLQKRGLLRLDCVRGLQVDDEGNLYVMHRPAERPWPNYLALSKYPASGGKPLWSRRWDGYIGQAGVIFAPCICIASKQHQTLDGKGYLYAAGKYSVQVIDCETGKLVGEFGSYGNMDCQGKGSKYPHPELPFGTISALTVWKDRLFVVDMLNRRIAKCRIVYDPTKR